MDDDIGEIAALCYSITLTVFVISSAILIFVKADGKLGAKLTMIWNFKWIYTSILSQVYDQATDIGVLIIWFQLATEQRSATKQVINMTLMVVLCIIFSIWSRIAVALYLGIKTHKSPGDALLSLFDLIIVKKVWLAVQSMVVAQNSQKTANNTKENEKEKEKEKQLETIETGKEKEEKEETEKLDNNQEKTKQTQDNQDTNDEKEMVEHNDNSLKSWLREIGLAQQIEVILGMFFVCCFLFLCVN